MRKVVFMGLVFLMVLVLVILVMLVRIVIFWLVYCLGLPQYVT